MASVGPVEFTVAVSQFPGDQPWVTPANALTNPSTFTNSEGSRGDLSTWLKVTNVAGALDAIGDTDDVDGIEVRITGEAHDDDVYDENVQLIVGGVVTGTDKSQVSEWGDGVNQTRVYGGPTDKWGLSSPTGATVKASDFGVAFKVLFDSGKDSGGHDIFLITVTVYYTGSGGGGSDTTKAMFALAA